MSDTMINLSKKRSYQVPYEVLEKRLESIPVEFLSDVSDFFDLLDYKISVIKSKEKDKLSTEAGMDLLKQITGCVSSDITIEDAKSEYFSEKYAGFITAHSISDVFFISRKSHNIESRKSIIKLLCNFFTILSERKEDFLSFVDNTEWNDLEDALQMKCSENANLDYIITRDAENGFRNSPVKIISPEDFLNLNCNSA